MLVTSAKPSNWAKLPDTLIEHISDYVSEPTSLILTDRNTRKAILAQCACRPAFRIKPRALTLDALGQRFLRNCAIYDLDLMLAMRRGTLTFEGARSKVWESPEQFNKNINVFSRRAQVEFMRDWPGLQENIAFAFRTGLITVEQFEALSVSKFLSIAHMFKNTFILDLVGNNEFSFAQLADYEGSFLKELLRYCFKFNTTPSSLGMTYREVFSYTPHQDAIFCHEGVFALFTSAGVSKERLLSVTEKEARALVCADMARVMFGNKELIMVVGIDLDLDGHKPIKISATAYEGIKILQQDLEQDFEASKFDTNKLLAIDGRQLQKIRARKLGWRDFRRASQEPKSSKPSNCLVM
jgi:hypothetical protein